MKTKAEPLPPQPCADPAGSLRARHCETQDSLSRLALGAPRVQGGASALTQSPGSGGGCPHGEAGHDPLGRGCASWGHLAGSPAAGSSGEIQQAFTALGPRGLQSPDPAESLVAPWAQLLPYVAGADCGGAPVPSLCCPPSGEGSTVCRRAGGRVYPPCWRPGPPVLALGRSWVVSKLRHVPRGLGWCPVRQMRKPRSFLAEGLSLEVKLSLPRPTVSRHLV